MTNTQNTAAAQYNARVAELRKAGLRLGEAREQAHSEAVLAELAVWRAQDPDR